MMEAVDVTVRFVVAMLVASLWQAPLFALVAWLVLRVAATANATTRHSVFAAALFASIALPVATATLATDHVAAAAAAAAPADDAVVQLSRGSRSYVPVKLAPASPRHTRVPAGVRAPVLAGSEPAQFPAASPSFARANLSVPHALAVAIVAMWFVVSGFMLLQLAVSLVHLERLKRDALPLPVAYRNGLARFAVAARDSRVVRLCRSDEIDIPIAVGLFDAMILLPTRFVDELPPSDVDAIVLHELAHLRRSDDWINAVERVARAILFFNPAIAWLAGRLDLEREVACDDWVLQQNDALPYATCLARVAESVIWPHRALTAPGIFGTRRGMSIRIERLLAKHRDVRVRTSFGLATSAAALLGALGLVAALVSPSIAYDAARGTAILAPPVPPSPRPPRVPVPPRVPDPPRAAIVAPAVPERPGVRVADAAAPAAPATPATPVRLGAPAPPERPAPPSRPTVRERIVADANDSSYAEALARTGYRDLSAGEIRRLKALDIDPAYIAAMRRRFGRTIGIDEIASLRALGVSPAYVDEISAAGLANLSVDETRRLRALGVDPDYVRKLVRSGYTGLSADDIARLRAVGVSPADAGRIERKGDGRPSISSLVRDRALGIDPDYVSAMRARFGPSLTDDDIAGLRALDVSGAYVDALKSAGLGDLTPERVRGLRALGVTADYVRELARAEYPNLSTDRLQQFRALGIDGDFIREAASNGYRHPSADKLVELKATGEL